MGDKLKFRTSDNITLHYDDFGTGQPIVMLTGIGGSRMIWQCQIQFLLKHGYRVINIDARNQGESEHTIKGRRIARHATDVYELLQQLQIKRCIMLGNSMGASTIFAFLSLFKKPEVLGVIDIDQSPKMISDDTWPWGFKTLSWQNFPELLTLPLGRATVTQIDNTILEQVKTVEKKYPYDVALNHLFLIDHAVQDWRDVLLNMQAPLLIVAGAESPYFKTDFAKASAALAPKGEAKIIKHAGHIVMAEQPDQFNAVLLDFLQRVMSAL